MVTKLCKQCGCQIPYPLAYCSKHQPVIDNTYYDRRRRNQKHHKFYLSKEWKATSLCVLQKNNYKCVCCGCIATEVHHIEDLYTSWERRLDITNLEPLCTRCHNKKR